MNIKTHEEILFHQNQNNLNMVSIISPALISTADNNSNIKCSEAVKDDFNNSSPAKDVKFLDLFLGSVKIPQDYNTKAYYKKFVEKNADKLKEKITCPVCCGSYTYFNKSKHIKSTRHIKLLEKYGTTMKC